MSSTAVRSTATGGSEADLVRVTHQSMRLVAHAETLGMVERQAGGGRHSRGVEAALEAFADAGIGRRGVALRRGARPSEEAVLLQELIDAVEDSPLPQYEWAAMSGLLGDELLAALVGTSKTSVSRYRSGSRSTPDAVAGRLHLVTLIVSDLSGSYNDFGIRRWFQRSRSALDGASPVEILSGDWDPDDEGVREVRGLAAALLGSPAT